MSSLLAAFLTEHGFAVDDINAPQADGRFTPLMRAAKLGRLDIVDELLALGVNPRLKNFDDFSALDLAASRHCLMLLKKVA